MSSAPSSSFPQQGIIAALWIPTDREGRPDRAALVAHVTWLRQRGIHGVLALGSTGEFPRIDLDQREAAVALVAELAAPLPVIANVSDIRPKAVAQLGRRARALGLAGVAIMPPGFFPNSQDDLLAHFLHASDAAQLPVLLYNFPELTGSRIALETVAAFADRAPLAGIKQSGREFDYHRALIALGKERNFRVFSGADTRLPEVFALGADGCIGGLVNFVPEPMVRIFDCCKRGVAGDIDAPSAQLREVGSIIDRLTFPLNVAAGMAARGLDVGEPKSVVSEASWQLYRGIAEDLRQRFGEWNLEGSPVLMSSNECSP